MATRKIITIDEAKCNGCGSCVTACAEGALKIVNGKAKLVKEQFCDGFGDCLGDCPTGALKIEEKESPAYDEAATKEHVRAAGGEAALRRFEEAAQAHEHKAGPAHQPPATGGHGHPSGGGCPGSRMRFAPKAETAASPAASLAAGHALPSELQQWPVQIHLVPPGAPFFQNRELAVLSTCSPIASADVHWRFIRGRGVVVGCPKLDNTDGYAEKLGAILSDRTIPKVVVVRMQVPCCGGLTMIVQEAVRLSGRKELACEEVTVGLDGNILSTRPIPVGV